MGILGSLFGGHKKTEMMNMKMETSGMHEHQHGGMSGMSSSGMNEPKGSAVADTAKDPVCNMDVDPATAAAKSDYMGKTYYFCAPGCKKAFDADPAKYVGGEEQKMTGHEHGGGCCC